VSSRGRINTPPLVASGPFPGRLAALDVATAIARGLAQDGLPAPDLCPLAPGEDPHADVRAYLDALDFDVRMRRARAVILAVASLQERTLAGRAAFEIATRARQGGVPAYAITASNRLDSFDARMLDLQVIIEASSTRALIAAGRKLARLM
jgi:glycerate kinase